MRGWKRKGDEMDERGA